MSNKLVITNINMETKTVTLSAAPAAGMVLPTEPNQLPVFCVWDEKLGCWIDCYGSVRIEEWASDATDGWMIYLNKPKVEE